MRLIAVLLITSFLVLITRVTSVHAQNISPQQNNYFGIHILDEHDLDNAAKLVNSNGGEWGYVTVVIREDERDINRWTNVFQRMKDLKLIPILRIATTMRNEGGWNKPQADQAIPWADFLNTLPWPTIEHYVILFNEPNHAKEWGGEINPEEYASISRHYWEEFKKVNPQFNVLPAALDLAAPNGRDTMDAVDFFDRMQSKDEYIFTIFDGWNSHSYPNPNFSGSPFDTGRKSIQGFVWETDYLYKYFLSPTTPIFITETGWKINNNVSEYYKIAFEQVWNKPNVKAVTPFLLNYREPPFSAFSWIDPKTDTFRPQYETVQLIPKPSGTPGV